MMGFFEVSARADLIFATTEGVARSLGGAAAGKTVLVPNGADVALFRAGRLSPCPRLLADIPKPRIGYCGSLNEKVDFALVDELATARPDWHWVLIGHRPPSAALPTATGDAFAACLARPNIHFLPAQAHRDLPAIQAHVQLNVMCYRTDGQGWWRDIYPLKLGEYLASGPPVVSADLAAVRPFAAVVSICRRRDDWLGAIAAALGGDAFAGAAERLAVAAANGWDSRVDRIARLLEALPE